MLEVILHHLTSDRAECLMYRGDLCHDVGAIPVFLNHLLQTAHLPFDPPEALRIAHLDVRVYRVRLALAPAGDACAAGGGRHGGR